VVQRSIKSGFSLIKSGFIPSYTIDYQVVGALSNRQVINKFSQGCCSREKKAFKNWWSATGLGEANKHTKTALEKQRPKGLHFTNIYYALTN